MIIRVKSYIDQIIIEDQLLFTILVSSASFSLFSLLFLLFKNVFLLKNIKENKRMDTINRLVQIVYSLHGFVIGNYGRLFLNFTCDRDNSSLKYAPAFGLGYHLYDIVSSYRTGVLDKFLLFHHISIVIFLTESSLLNSGGFLISLAGSYIDITTVLSYIRIIYRNQRNKRHTKMYLLLEYLYIVLFFILRGLYIYESTCVLFNNCRTKIFFSLLGHWFLVIYSIILGNKLLKILKIRIKEQKERNKRKVNLFWFRENEEVYELDYIKRSKVKQ